MKEAAGPYELSSPPLLIRATTSQLVAAEDEILSRARPPLQSSATTPAHISKKTATSTNRPFFWKHDVNAMGCRQQASSRTENDLHEATGL